MIRDYSTVFAHEASAKLCQDGDEAVTKCELWEWLKEFRVKENEGFEFTKHENIDKILEEMKYKKDHSGFSFAWTMRQLQFVAIHGFEQLKESALKKRNEKENLESTED